MEKDLQSSAGSSCHPDSDLDGLKTSNNDESQEAPEIANLIDVDEEVNEVTNKSPEPTGNPLHIDLKDKLHVSGPILTIQPQPLMTNTEFSVSCPTQREPLPTIDEREALQIGDDPSPIEDHRTQCDNLKTELDKIKSEKSLLTQEVCDLKSRLKLSKEELEKEVQKRVELEQRFTEEAKRTSDQIEELVAKSDSDDTKLNELKNRFELYSRETSSMIESFTTNRESLASQLLELRKENDFLLGQYLSKARDLQSAAINLPQNIEELQFHCLTLNEKLILSTMAKERLEETVMLASTTTPTPAANVPNTTN